MIGDEFELLAVRAVLGLPLGVAQVAGDGDPPALGEVAVAHLGLAAEDGDVDVVRAAVLAFA